MRKILTIAIAFASFAAGAQVLDSTYHGIGYSAGLTWPSANKIVQQSDGSMIIGVNSSLGVTMVKYTPEGRPDSTVGAYGRASLVVGGCVTFSPGGQVISDVAVQSDDMVIGVGYGNYTYGGACGYNNMDIFRMKQNFTGDSTFGLCGLIESGQIFGSYPININSSELSKLKLLPDGKFLVAGNGYCVGCSGLYSIYIRFNGDGSLDPTFGTGGILTVAGIFNNSFANNPADISVDTAGNIIAIGNSTLSDSVYHPYAQAVRITSAGVLDTTFGTGGIVNFMYPGGNGVTAIQPRNDGKYAIIGGYGSNGTLAIINSVGDIDSTIIPAGYATISLPGYATNRITSFYSQPDNKLVLAGYGLNGYDACAYIARLNEDGSYDSTFNGIGVDTFNYGVYSHWQMGTFLNDIKPVCGNRALAAGGINQTTTSPNQGMFIVRLKMDDTSTCTYTPLPSLAISAVNAKGGTVNVYPNPAFDELTIENAQPGSAFSILNIMGQTMLSGNIDANKQTANISHLPTGSYIIRLKGTDGSTVTQKITKL